MFRGNSFLATLDVYNVDKCASAKDFRESSIDRPTSIVTRAINLIFYPYDFEKSNKLKVLRNSLGVLLEVKLVEKGFKADRFDSN